MHRLHGSIGRCCEYHKMRPVLILPAAPRHQKKRAALFVKPAFLPPGIPLIKPRRGNRYPPVHDAVAKQWLFHRRFASRIKNHPLPLKARKSPALPSAAHRASLSPKNRRRLRRMHVAGGHPAHCRHRPAPYFSLQPAKQRFHRPCCLIIYIVSAAHTFLPEIFNIRFMSAPVCCFPCLSACIVRLRHGYVKPGSLYAKIESAGTVRYVL